MKSTAVTRTKSWSLRSQPGECRRSSFTRVERRRLRDESSSRSRGSVSGRWTPVRSEYGVIVRFHAQSVETASAYLFGRSPRSRDNFEGQYHRVYEDG